MIRGALLLGAIGVALSALGLVLDPRQALMSYLAAYTALLGVPLGALTLVMTLRLIRARWFEPFRQPAEAAAATLPLFALLFIPILVGLDELYPWALPAALTAPELGERAGEIGVYLNGPFFIARAAIYFAVWLGLALSLLAWSARRSDDRREHPAWRERALSALGLPALGFTLSFASFDWLMSLTPAWHSTIYGLYYFSGAFLGGLALLGVAGSRMERAAMPDATHSLGTLLLTFVLFWAYIAFCQYLIVWIGDIPAEVAWYVPRTRGSWGLLGLVLIAGHFALPFLALLPRRVKRSRTLVGLTGAWLLVMHYLDVYWLVLPVLHPAGIAPHWLDLATLAAVGGLAVAAGGWWGHRTRLREPLHE